MPSGTPITATESRERKRLRAAAYYAAHRDKCVQRQSAYYKANRETKLADQSQYDALHKGQRKAWRKANPSNRKKERATRRARLAGADVGETESIRLWEIEWKSRPFATCYWCKSKVASKGCQTDHIIPLSKAGPHSLGNLCISCAPCNLTKQAKPLAEWNRMISEPVLF